MVKSIFRTVAAEATQDWRNCI